MIIRCDQQKGRLNSHQLLLCLRRKIGRPIEVRFCDAKTERLAHLNGGEAGFVTSIRDSAKNKNLCHGARAHADLVKKGLVEKTSCAIVSMYAKCGAPKKAQELLLDFPTVDVFTWTSLITAYSQAGCAQNALFCYERMQDGGLSPDAVTFASVLKACGSVGALEKGTRIHHQIAERGLLRNNAVLGTALIDMYAKCGVLCKAAQVLEGLSSRDVVSWNTLLAGYVQHGENHNALCCFEKMQREGFCANAATFVYVLRACGNSSSIEIGKRVHDDVVKQGLLMDNIYLGKALVAMYCKCGALDRARLVLEELPHQDLKLWSMLIAKYVEQAKGEEALACFEQMEQRGLFPDAVTFICILKACCCTGSVNKGGLIHEQILKQGLLKDNALLGTALIDMYVKCGAVEKAGQVFDELPCRDVVTWSALIGGCAQVGEGKEALKHFDSMRLEGFSPNPVTYMNVLKACATVGAIDKGEVIHYEIAKQGILQQHAALGNALVDMYVKCQNLLKARQVLEGLPFRDVVSWNALIAGYSQQRQGQEALVILKQMEHDGVSPDAVTFTCVLKACGSIGAVNRGKEIHDEIARQGLLGDVVLSTALLDMYVKCGLLVKAHEVLNHVATKDVICWTALLAGYAEAGHAEKALNCFRKAQCTGVNPDAAMLSSMLNVCIYSGLGEMGQRLFSSIKQTFCLDPDLHHYAYLVDLFGRLGHSDKFGRVISKMPDLDILAIWSRLLGVCQAWGNVSIGQWAFQHAVRLDEGDA